MHDTSFRKALLAVSLLATAGYAGSAAAHNFSGSLGKTAKATDLMQVSCSDDGNGPPSRLVVSILDSSAQKPTPNPTISIQLLKTATTGSQAANSTDPAEDAKYSPEISVVGGTGPYLIMVDHNKAGGGNETYDMSYHCITSNGVHTGTQEPPSILQNQ